MKSVDGKILDWMLYGNLGASARTMAVHLTGREQPANGAYHNWPVDGSDFARCLELLEAVPELLAGIHRMAELGPQWAALVARWNEIESSLRRELAVRGYVTPPTPLTDALIRSCLRPGARAA